MPNFDVIAKGLSDRCWIRTLACLCMILMAGGVVCAGAGDDPQAAAPASGILEATRHSGSLIGLQYETFFTPHNVGSYETAEAIPILGKYSSYDVDVICKHEEWFEDLGIDWLLLDWSNMLWTHPEWEKHEGSTGEIEASTALLFKTYRQLEKEGKHPPKLVIMLGLQNGKLIPNGVQRMNNIIAWTKANFLDNPEYENLWLYYHGKPLLTILYHVRIACPEIKTRTSGIVAPDWTVRWVGSQLQDTHVEDCGFWSWMDGTIRQVVTRSEGAVEETVVTPSSFPMPGGWLHPRATGRDHGAPYLESWEVAFETHAKFIQIHQWNEFVGQAEGQGFGPAHDIYGDEYNLEFSDDIEPTAMDQCAYRGCGGWGYYYMNLTKAILSLYREATPDITVLTLSAPFQPVVREKNLHLDWRTLGRIPKSYKLELDGHVVADRLTGNSYALSLSAIPPGKHHITLTARGVHTYFDLSPSKLATRSSQPLPVTSEVEFTYSPGTEQK
jgi:hypothetical protein